MRGVLSTVEIPKLASKIRNAVGADAGKASCHSDYADGDIAKEMQKQIPLVELQRE
jgi:phosphomethylpyrimidine synthase